MLWLVYETLATDIQHIVWGSYEPMFGDCAGIEYFTDPYIFLYSQFLLTIASMYLLYIRLIQKQRLSDRNSFTEEA